MFIFFHFKQESDLHQAKISVKKKFFSISCKNHSGKLKIFQNSGLFWSEKLWAEAASLEQTQHRHLKLDLTETQPLHAVGRASLSFLSGLFDVSNFMLCFRIQNKMVASWLFDEVLFISKWGGYCEDVLRVFWTPKQLFWFLIWATQQLLLSDLPGNQTEGFIPPFYWPDKFSHTFYLSYHHHLIAYKSSKLAWYSDRLNTEMLTKIHYRVAVFIQTKWTITSL